MRTRVPPAASVRTLSRVEHFFGPGGRLEAVLAGYEPRPEQAALAGQVELALELGEHLLAEAGTGTGKSLAYLIPVLDSGRRWSSLRRPRPSRNSF